MAMMEAQQRKRRVATRQKAFYVANTPPCVNPASAQAARFVPATTTYWHAPDFRAATTECAENRQRLTLHAQQCQSDSRHFPSAKRRRSTPVSRLEAEPNWFALRCLRAGRQSLPAPFANPAGVWRTTTAPLRRPRPPTTPATNRPKDESARADKRPVGRCDGSRQQAL